MLKKDVSIGKTYVAKISNVLVEVRLDSVSPYGGWNATNLKTGRSVRIKSAGKLRREVKPTANDGPDALKSLLRLSQ